MQGLNVCAVHIYDEAKTNLPAKMRPDRIRQDIEGMLTASLPKVKLPSQIPWN